MLCADEWIHIALFTLDKHHESCFEDQVRWNDFCINFQNDFMIRYQFQDILVWLRMVWINSSSFTPLLALDYTSTHENISRRSQLEWGPYARELYSIYLHYLFELDKIIFDCLFASKYSRAVGGGVFSLVSVFILASLKKLWPENDNIATYIGLFSGFFIVITSVFCLKKYYIDEEVD